jgi:hypothetical protein
LDAVLRATELALFDVLLAGGPARFDDLDLAMRRTV